VAHGTRGERLDDLLSIGPVIRTDGSGGGHRRRRVKNQVEVRALRWTVISQVATKW
jgi:hypothetical protein